ncbi:MAG: nuclear transport factor 2 family protein [Thermomicrobiales bacterium]
MLDRAAAEAFAAEWVAAWNARDVEAVLSHFAAEARFTSPRAAQRVGTAVVEGKTALGAYWRLAAAQATSLHFVLDHVVWDEARQELVILYTNERDGQRTRACEWLRFGPNGLAVEGAALYGAVY